MQENIIVKGARENNLKNIDVSIPRDKLVVLTGLSGCGQSRRWRLTPSMPRDSGGMSSRLSSYARHVSRADGQAGRGLHRRPLPRHLHRPEDHLAESRARRSARSRRSTTICAFSGRACGTPHCPKCGKEIQQPDDRPDRGSGDGAAGEGTRIQMLAPVIRGKEGRARQGFRGRPASQRLCPRACGREYVRPDARRSSSTRTKSTASRSWWTASS